MIFTVQLCDHNGEPLPYEWNSATLQVNDLIRYFGITRKRGDLYAEKGGRWLSVVRIVAGDAEKKHRAVHAPRVTAENGRFVTLVDPRAPLLLASGYRVDLVFGVDLPMPHCSKTPIARHEQPLLYDLIDLIPHSPDQDPAASRDEFLWAAMNRVSHG